eukprot:COSAG01_NODE_2160_length_8268_cov_230.522830_12_plen_303_part_00
MAARLRGLRGHGSSSLHVAGQLLCLCLWCVCRLPASAGAGAAQQRPQQHVHVCTCACCESCPSAAQDAGSFGVDGCSECTEERCRTDLALPVGACPAAGGSVNATCTAASDTPYATVAQYMDERCETGTGEPVSTHIIGKCYTKVDSGLSSRIDCSGRAATTTTWTAAPGGEGPFCPRDEGIGPLLLGTPDGACTEGTPGMGYYKVAYYSGGGVGGVCPGSTPPRCSFNTSDAHPGQGLGHCEPPGNCPEIAGCGCGLLQGFCTSNPDANCQIPKCCNCCMWPCQLTPDPETCCEQYPACCL